MSVINPELLNGANLAYIGDAYYELAIRKYLLEKGITNQHKLHKMATNYVSAKGHSLIVDNILSSLTEQEVAYYNRGRNHGYHLARKNVQLNEYLQSSGFEALIGFLFLSKQMERLNQIIALAIKIIEENNE